MRRCRRDRSWSTPPSARRSSSRSIRGRDDDRRAPRRRPARRVRARSLLAPWAEARGAVSTPGAERADRASDRGAAEGRLLRGENHADGRARERRSRRQHHDHRQSRSARSRRVCRRPAAIRSPGRAGAGRARRLGRRRSARGFDQPDRGVLARAGIPGGGRAAHARGEKRRADHHLHREAWTAIACLDVRNRRERDGAT
jgi:hypothetical protein